MKSWTTGKTLMAGTAVGAALLGMKYLQNRTGTDISGEVALITGSTRGIGYLIARELGREGCKLVICARSTDELQLAERDLAAQGFEVLALQCDVSDAEQVQKMVDRATEHYGRIDILVNNAGIIQVGPVQSMTRTDFEDAMDIMFWGTVHPTFSVLPQMTERQSGRIVNITSVGGKVSVPHLAPYSAAKFAATGFSEGLHAELKKDGINVTTIVPGLMRTGSFVNAQFKGDVENEYVWFSLGSSLPIFTLDAERAARQIVAATKRGEAERILSIPANLLSRMHGLAPATTTHILRLVNDLILPDSKGTQADTIAGKDVQNRVDSEALRTATALGRDATRRFQPVSRQPVDAHHEDGNRA